MKQTIQISLQALLIAILAVNAVGPMPAVALSLRQPDAGLPMAQQTHFISSEHNPVKDTALLPNPTPKAALNGTATLDVSPTSTSDDEDATVTTETATSTEETATATSTMTLSPTTPEITATDSVSDKAQQPQLSFDFSASPQQVAPGDEVTFTLKLTNTGQSALTGLSFSNTLPEIFDTTQNGFKDFDFDPQTRLLTWSGSDQSDQTGLPVGESLTLQYSVRVDAQAGEGQIVDSAVVSADGLDQPVLAETTLTILPRTTELTQLGQLSGHVDGLGGKVKLDFPGGALPATRWVRIHSLQQDTGATDLTFALEMYDLQDTGATPTATQNDEQGGDQDLALQPVEAKFNRPVDLTVSFDGIADLARLSANQEPYLVTLDEASNTWVRVPLKEVNREANTITAEITHFSTWGAGIGASVPQNGANILLYDSPYPDLFTGRSSFSIPIWTPPGRNGMAPSLALTYSSNLANGILGDIQAPWVGMGWNIDTIEIARKITNGSCSPCGSGSYGYENSFLLLINGTGYELIPDGTTAGRYHTKSESFVYIQLHNDDLGNNSPSASNTTGEWWEVVQKDGTRWRLGWNDDSEQLAAMAGYPGAATGSWSSLGYAGHANDLVALRWRADQVTDTHGNLMALSYSKEIRLVAGTSAYYDRASYLDTIDYTGHTSATPSPGYSVVFVRESRGGSEVPSSPTDWDNWDTERLDTIEVRYGATVVRMYDLGYDVRSYTDDSVSWDTLTLTSVAVSGDSTDAPTVNFTYIDEDNRANCGTGCQEWAYPRLETVDNGTGGMTTYTYGNDSQLNSDWYNWRVEGIDTSDGVSANPMTTLFAYGTPCYRDVSAGWCNTGPTGELVGYDQTIVTTKDFDGTSILAISVHNFNTDEQKAGREYQVQHENASSTVLSETDIAYTVVTSGLPSGGYFTYASVVEQYLYTTSLVLVGKTEYQCDTSTGNLTLRKDYDGTPTLYRQVEYEYVTNTSPSVWILDKVSKRFLKDAGGTVISEQQHGYDGSLPGSGSPTVGELTLTRLANGTQTVDVGYVYDTYGNLTETRAYTSYGTSGSAVSGSYRSSSVDYETTLYTYATSATNALSQSVSMSYDYALGLPTTITDANSATTTTTYDGLGRATSITYDGSSQANVQYIYPTGTSISAPFVTETDVWDDTASAYRPSWQITDGLGRTIQSQGPYETSGYLVLTDTSYNALGLAQDNGLPRTLTGTGGTYYAPSWGSLPHNTADYDALGRLTKVTYPDSSQESMNYSGLRTISVDRDSHQKVQENDAFGRLVKVEEYTGSGPYNLYTTTTYEYDERDLLTLVTDAQNNQTTITYNGFGRKTDMIDPDMGSWSYDYDVFGNLTSQTDARGCVTSVTYDDLNRPTGKSYSGSGACGSTPSVTYTYDSTASGNKGIGRRTGMSDGSGSTSWFYNSLGQVTNQTRTVDSTNYSLDFTYDTLNRLLTQTLPSSETLNYSYNDMGILSGLSGTNTYVSQIHYSASGQVTDQLLGNGLIQQFCYEADTLRLAETRTYAGSLQSCGTGASSPKLDLGYSYQSNGNISQMTDVTRSETINYTYDELNRLTSATGPYNYSHTYDALGSSSGKTVTDVMSAISTGNSHTCGLLLNSNGVQCWGDNTYGQLGDGTETERTTPVDVSGLTSGVTSVDTGNGHTCALTSGGGVKCWGDNTDGQLGDGSTTQSSTPVDVSGLTSGVIAISAGGSHTCALTSSGGVKCWGRNANGQLGDGSTTQSSTPVNVSGLTSGVVAITAGGSHTCALTTTGEVKCWGSNGNGQLGDGSTTGSSTPVDVTGLTSSATSISAGNTHTCVVTDSGGAQCWGSNFTGALGDGTFFQRTTPVDVSGLTSGVAIVSAGAGFTCALMTGGGAQCWGMNSLGQVGDETTTTRFSPVDVSGLTSGATAISAGGSHACALTNTAETRCWGSTYYGQSGNGRDRLRTTAVDVTGLTSGAVAVSTGRDHACAVTDSGGVQCWGSNLAGQIGDGTGLPFVRQRPTPVDVSGLTSGVDAIAAGYQFTCALISGGGVQCWGANGYGQLGDSTTTPHNTPTDVSGLTSGVDAIATGDFHACALTSSGGVKCWGNNTYGQLGDGSTTDSSTPVDVSGLTSGVIAIAAGGYHTCALTSGNGVKCWGNNMYGQLGDGSTTDSSTPVNVSGLTSGVASISAGGLHTCVVTNSSAAKCWGDNTYGQLGDGSTTQSSTAVSVSGLTSGAAFISAGGYHTCAVTTTGGAKCWGNNSNGQLGDGTTTDSSTPVDVSGLTSNVSAISASMIMYHTCALTTSGGLKCWGDTMYGELGNGEEGFYTTPVLTLLNSETITDSYTDSSHVHAVTALSTGESYSYDDNGNMTSRTENGVTYIQVFDAENRLVSVTTGGQTTQFIYDGDGNMVKKINPDNSSVIYIEKIYEIQKDSSGTVTHTLTFYPAGNALRLDSTLYYIIQDRLGSASVLTDASGNTVGEQRYFPTGETRVATGTMPTDRLYTGQRNEGDLGIYDYGARFYDAKLGKFLSADSVVPDMTNPQAFNRYAYAMNNPILYNDPTGHDAYSTCGGNAACMSYVNQNPQYLDHPPATVSSTPSATSTPKKKNGGPADDPNWGSEDPVARAQIVWDAICESGGWWGNNRCPSEKELSPWLLYEEGADLSYADQYNMARGIHYRWSNFGYTPQQLSGFTAFYNPNGDSAWDQSDWTELTNPQVDLNSYTGIITSVFQSPAKPEDGNYIYWFDQTEVVTKDKSKWPGTYIETSTVTGLAFYFTGIPDVRNCAMRGISCKP